MRCLYDEERFISRRDYNIYIYLFLEEDISTLAAFDYYLLSNDRKEFMDNMRLI